MSHLEDLLSALIDGELTGAELDRANAHLAACATCRAEAAVLRRLKCELRALAAEVDDTTVPGAELLTQRLLALGRAEPRRRRSRRRRGRTVLLSAVSLLVVGIGAAAFAVGGSSGGGRPVTPQLEMFDVHNALTTGQVPFADPTDIPPETPHPLCTVRGCCSVPQ